MDLHRQQNGEESQKPIPDVGKILLQGKFPPTRPKEDLDERNLHTINPSGLSPHFKETTPAKTAPISDARIQSMPATHSWQLMPFFHRRLPSFSLPFPLT